MVAVVTKCVRQWVVERGQRRKILKALREQRPRVLKARREQRLRVLKARRDKQFRESIQYARTVIAEINASCAGQPSAWAVVCDGEEEPSSYFTVPRYARKTRSGELWTWVPC